MNWYVCIIIERIERVTSTTQCIYIETHTEGMALFWCSLVLKLSCLVFWYFVPWIKDMCKQWKWTVDVFYRISVHKHISVFLPETQFDWNRLKSTNKNIFSTERMRLDIFSNFQCVSVSAPWFSRYYYYACGQWRWKRATYHFTQIETSKCISTNFHYNKR